MLLHIEGMIIPQLVVIWVEIVEFYGSVLVHSFHILFLICMALYIFCGVYLFGWLI